MTKVKAKYKEKMFAYMSSNMRKAWQGIKNMSGQAKPKDSNYDLMSNEEQTTLANSLNTFYTRFNNYTPPDAASVPDSASDADTTPPAADDDVTTTPTTCEPPQISVEEVRKQFSRCKVGKSSGPDGLSTKVLKACAYELVR